MAKEKKLPEPPEEVPKWFMTYSDVITLLMTFFILLLTFATNEPERFEKMKNSMFGGSGSTGIAGQRTDGLDRDSLVMRIRPDASRKADRGADFPPVDRDVPEGALDKGLSGLEKPESEVPANSMHLTVPIAQLVTTRNQATEYGKKTLQMFAKLAHQRSLFLRLETNNDDNLERLLVLVDYLSSSQLMKRDRIGVSFKPELKISSHHIRFDVQFIDGVQSVQKKKETAQ